MSAYMGEAATLAVSRGGLREALKMLEDKPLNDHRCREALRVIEHVATLMRAEFVIGASASVAVPTTEDAK